MCRIRRDQESANTRLRESVEAPVRREGRPIQFLASPGDKETLVQEMVARDRVRHGTICLLSCIENCRTFDLHRDRATKKIHLRSAPGKCLHYYKYLVHPHVGYCYASIQTWFPFRVQIYLNGREWLCRQLDAARLRYRRVDNTYLRIDNLPGAQRLLDAQLTTHWPTLLHQILGDLHPDTDTFLGRFEAPYYWSVHQAEWATDVMFKSAARLAQLYPRIALHGFRSLSCADALRFLDEKRPVIFRGDARNRLTERTEGLRLKHAVNGNLLKIYDKAYGIQRGDASVLRVETTINHPREFRVYRSAEGDPDGPKQWRPLRKGVADLHRLAEVAQGANDRYAQAIASCDETEPVERLMADLVRPVRVGPRRHRGLRPWAPDDLALLRAVNHGEFALNGLRNRDLCRLLYPQPTADAVQQRRRSARIGRLLRLLRAHGIVHKIPRTHRDRVSAVGRKILAAVLAAAAATTAQLTQLAA